MRLVIKNRIISAPIDIILEKVRSETGYLKDIVEKHEEIICTCPFHKDGKELKPACFVYNNQEGNLEYGTFHCFACGEKGSLPKLIGKCFGKDYDFGRKWLVENFGDTYLETREYLPEITATKQKNFLDESELDSYEYDNQDALNYLINKRHLSKDVIDLFKVGFEKETNSVTFPCRNEQGQLVGIFKRNISTKFFTIPQIEPKPIYLLDYVIKQGYRTVCVVESQINALTLWGWGIPAIALFGTGSDAQYKMLKKSGIRTYVLAFDGDLAGDIGSNKFIKNIGDDVLVRKLILPKGKDVNDLTKEEFLSLKSFQPKLC